MMVFKNDIERVFGVGATCEDFKIHGSYIFFLDEKHNQLQPTWPSGNTLYVEKKYSEEDERGIIEKEVKDYCRYIVNCEMKRFDTSSRKELDKLISDQKSIRY